MKRTKQGKLLDNTMSKLFVEIQQNNSDIYQIITELQLISVSQKFRLKIKFSFNQFNEIQTKGFSPIGLENAKLTKCAAKAR